MGPARPIELGYAAPTCRPRHGTWALVGFGLAVLSCVVPLAMGWTIWFAHATGSAVFDVSVSPSYYVFPAAAILLCFFGSRGRRKLFPVIGIIVSLLAVSGVLALVSRAW